MSPLGQRLVKSCKGLPKLGSCLELAFSNLKTACECLRSVYAPALCEQCHPRAWVRRLVKGSLLVLIDLTSVQSPSVCSHMPWSFSSGSPEPSPRIELQHCQDSEYVQNKLGLNTAHYISGIYDIKEVINRISSFALPNILVYTVSCFEE